MRQVKHIFIRELDPSNKIIFTSGRVSLDLVFKASRVSVPVVVTNSSVTHSAAVLADRIGLAIIGYARGFFAKFPFFGGLLILPGKDKVL